MALVTHWIFRFCSALGCLEGGGGTAGLTPYPTRGSRPGYFFEGRATGTQDNRISPFCSNPDSHISEDFTISPHCGSVLLNFWFPNPLAVTATVFRETLWSLAKVGEFGLWLKCIPMLPSIHIKFLPNMSIIVHQRFVNADYDNSQSQPIKLDLLLKPITQFSMLRIWLMIIF